MQRRIFLTGTALGGLAAILSPLLFKRQEALAKQAEETFPFTLPDEEWRKRLSKEQYAVLRGEGTERAFSSPLNEEKRKGIFHCAGCDFATYDSATKFDSGTGWPSFYQAIANGVGTHEDVSFFMRRTEAHCANCGSHLGHVFDDGPPPTGLRHCINGVALSFKPASV